MQREWIWFQTRPQQRGLSGDGFHAQGNLIDRASIGLLLHGIERIPAAVGALQRHWRLRSPQCYSFASIAPSNNACTLSIPNSGPRKQTDFRPS